MGDEIKKKLQEEEYTADSYNSWLESRHSDPKSIIPFGNSDISEYFLRPFQ